MARIWRFLNQDVSALDPLADRWIRFERKHRVISSLPAVAMSAFVWFAAGWKWAVASLVASFVVIPAVLIAGVWWEQRRRPR